MKKEVIAVDLGGTNLRVGLIRKGKIVRQIKKKHSKEKNLILKELTKAIQELITKQTKGIGVAFAGPVKNGIVKNPPNLPFRNFDMKSFLEKKFKIRVELENDVHCTALAEAKLGCKKKNFLVLALGTGIGGGIIINNKLYQGQGYAGEFGHIILNNGKDFETLWKMNKKLTKQLFGEELLLKDLIKINNSKSKRILNEITQYLGEAIASLIDIFDPEVVILAGGIQEAGPKLAELINYQVKKYMFLPKAPKVMWTTLKSSELLGAGLLFAR